MLFLAYDLSLSAGRIIARSEAHFSSLSVLAGTSVFFALARVLQSAYVHKSAMLIKAGSRKQKIMSVSQEYAPKKFFYALLRESCSGLLFCALCRCVLKAR